MPICVVDSACLIGLERISRLELLPRIFPNIVVPPAVVREFGRSPEWLDVIAPRNAKLVLALNAHLGAGESEVIALGTEQVAAVLILDDAPARSAARAMDLLVIGTLGLLIRAKQRGHITSVKPLVDELAESGFYVSADLVHRVLRLAGE